MNIGLIGSGGREHALCKKIRESKLVKKIICFPGNAGTSSIATNVQINISDFNLATFLDGMYVVSFFIVSSFGIKILPFLIPNF